MRQLVYLPYMKNIHRSSKHSRLSGRGGSVLLGGVGSASSYESPDDYMETTGRKLGKGLGCGLGLGMDKSGLNKKLESLSITPQKQKSKNIRFNL